MNRIAHSSQISLYDNWPSAEIKTWIESHTPTSEVAAKILKEFKKGIEIEGSEYFQEKVKKTLANISKLASGSHLLIQINQIKQNDSDLKKLKISENSQTNQLEHHFNQDVDELHLNQINKVFLETLNEKKEISIFQTNKSATLIHELTHYLQFLNNSSLQEKSPNVENMDNLDEEASITGFLHLQQELSGIFSRNFACENVANMELNLPLRISHIGHDYIPLKDLNSIHTIQGIKEKNFASLTLESLKQTCHSPIPLMENNSDREKKFFSILGQLKENLKTDNLQEFIQKDLLIELVKNEKYLPLVGALSRHGIAFTDDLLNHATSEKMVAALGIKLKSRDCLRRGLNPMLLKRVQKERLEELKNANIDI